MKKSLLSRMPVFYILVTGMLLFVSAGTSNAQSQTLASDQLSTPPKGPFVAPGTAITILEAELVKFKSQMAGLPHTSPVYKQANWKYVYYELIIKLLNDGKGTSSDDVSIAIARGLGIYATDLYGDIPQQQKVLNKQAAVSLLKA